MRYCYVTSTGQEAPTLVVNPGDQLIIHFTNNLPVPAGMMSNMNPCDGMMGTNMTNLHFHGTNIAPTCGQDEVVNTLVSPGQSFDYRVTIPTTEVPGLYWYHPHPHGFSEEQVQGGATGALIVQGIQNTFPALAAMLTRTLVIRDQLLPASEANDNNIPAWALSLNYVPVTYPNYSPAVIATIPAEQELWRVVNSAADTILNLQYIVNGAAQPMQVYAIDGYSLSSGSATAMTTIPLGPGARAEFVVTTPNAGDTAQLVTQYQNTGPDGDFDPARPLANVVCRNGALAPAHPVTGKLTARPGWLAAGGGTAFACVVLIVFPRRRGRNIALGVLAMLAVVFTIAGCGGGAAKTDPGTAKGTYMVAVTATAGSGSSQYQSSVNVPITIQ